MRRYFQSTLRLKEAQGQAVAGDAVLGRSDASCAVHPMAAAPDLQRGKANAELQ